jgi:hypothetical protein
MREMKMKQPEIEDLPRSEELFQKSFLSRFRSRSRSGSRGLLTDPDGSIDFRRILIRNGSMLLVPLLAILTSGCKSKVWIDDRACTDPDVVTVCHDVHSACEKASSDIRATSEKPAAAGIVAERVCNAYKEKCNKCGAPPSGSNSAVGPRGATSGAQP